MKYFYLGDSLINWDNVTSVNISESEWPDFSKEEPNYIIRVHLVSGGFEEIEVKSKEIAEEWREKTITSLLIS